MKILLTRPTDFGQDYLCDCVFHGLRQMFGADVVDAPKLWYMYKDNFGPGKLNLAETVYGRGFTIFATLDDLEVDREDIEQKIASRYFDLVVIARIDHGTPYMASILANYKPSEIIILDGQDASHIHEEFIGKGIYFKRELYHNIDKVYPISFAYPREKIQPPGNKVKLFSHVDPRNTSTYVHFTESTYYTDYNEALFGVTTMKAGWDCMRHYEILGCRAIPLFLDIKGCPPNICTTLPKDLLVEVLDKMQNFSQSWFGTPDGLQYYAETEYKMHMHFINNCLTDILAKSIIDKHIQLRD